ncbi:hypothetical protein [Bradyrhizobium sp. 76]|uniref:hypothetical protein n=1 Tax=Bradyrhizobium sp. 76 TaxID=2782680 RepID=UPI001FF70CB1|nr:hypothetical protein [Bradyrhizobium sp. 76]MCK1406668.1 hypothetical protein [Bradyrhizobium sp. 76]
MTRIVARGAGSVRYAVDLTSIGLGVGLGFASDRFGRREKQVPTWPQPMNQGGDPKAQLLAAIRLGLRLERQIGL